MELKIQVVWDRHKYAAGLNQLYVFFSLLYCSISNVARSSKTAVHKIVHMSPFLSETTKNICVTMPLMFYLLFLRYKIF